MMDIKNYTIEELEAVAEQIRGRILATVSKNGGHLSSTLGATDLIVAMHKVFDVAKDPFIFDVSHQAYAHKLLTDRWDTFDTLRTFGGISGYTKPSESPYDYYVAGHSSTSISLAVGAAKAIALKKEERIPVAFIGDGSMSAGMVYEALNELGDRKYPMIIILNDNEMSIAKPIGAISRMLSSAMASPFYQRFEYIGPVDGHDIAALVETMEVAKNLGKPIIIHAQTTKGKGYEIAEGTKEHWHGVGAFDTKTGEPFKKSSAKSATQIFSETLVKMADEDEKIVGVTAAMPSGTGLSAAMEKYPERFWDVAIAEQHAVASMGPLAKEGFKPFCAIYSTFLQRGYDQVVHDICLMDLGVVFAIDRAGIVGEDGETHQGAFDISYLRVVPNMTLLAPFNETGMQKVMAFAKDFQTPCAFRYPRGAFLAEDFDVPDYELGKAYLLQEGENDVLFIGYGNGVGRALQTAQLMETAPAVLDLRFVKPLDEVMLESLSTRYRHWFVFSDSAKKGGVASAIGEYLDEEGMSDVALTSFEYDDAFITHGNTKLVEESLGLLPEQLVESVREKLKIKN